MPERGDEARRAEALDRFWDGVQRGAVPSDAGSSLDPASAAGVRRLHELGEAMAPDAAFLRTLREDLMHAHAMGRPAPVLGGEPGIGTDGGTGTTANGHAPGGRLPLPLPHRPPTARRSGRRRGWLGPWGRAVDVAAAAVLVLAIAAGTLVGVGGLPGRDGAPAAVPAIAQTMPGAAVVPGTAMQRGNAARTGEVAGPGPVGEPKLAWEAAIDGLDVWFGRPPTVVDGVAYLGGVQSSEVGGTMAEAGLVVALDAASGAERWRAEVISADDADALTGAPDDTPPSVFVNQPTVAAGMAFVGTVVDTPVDETTRRDPRTNEEWVAIETETEGAVVALDAASGAERWRVETGGGGWMSPAVAGGLVYVPADGAVLALDAASGGERWRADASGAPAGPGEEPWTGLVAVGDGLVFATSNGRVLRALDAATGAERWRLEANADGWVGDPVVADGAVYVWSDAGAEERARAAAADAPPISVLHVLDAATGNVRWRHEGLGQTPTVGAGQVFLSTDRGDGTGVVALDAMTGRERWSATVEGFAEDTPLLAGGVLYFGTFDQGPLANLGPIGDLLGLGERNYLHALDATTGRRLWRIETRAYESAPAVADGTAFLVADGGEDRAGTLHAYGEG